MKDRAIVEHQPCARCGVPIWKKQNRKTGMCRDCYAVDPTWGTVSYRETVNA